MGWSFKGSALSFFSLAMRLVSAAASAVVAAKALDLRGGRYARFLEPVGDVGSLVHHGAEGVVDGVGLGIVGLLFFGQFFGLVEER